MLKLPFMISDQVWKDLKPRAIDDIYKRKDLTPEQEASLGIFRTVDLRVEWVCQHVVRLHNAVVLLAFITVIALISLFATTPAALTWILKLVPFVQ